MTSSRPPRKRGRPKYYQHQRVDTHMALSSEVVAALDEIAPGRRSAFVDEWLRQHPQVEERLAKPEETK